VRRRDFVALCGGLVLLSPFTAHGQGSSGRPLVGYLAGGKRAVVADLVGAFQQGMRELGWSEGSNIDIVYRFAEARPDRLPALAEELVRLKPAVILAGAVDTAVAMRELTTTIPIVSPALADAVHLGLIESLARPGHNVTGLTPYLPNLPSKQLELAREIVPGAIKVGVIGNMNDPKARPQREEVEATGETLAVKVVAADVEKPEDISGAIQRLVSEGVQALVVLQTTMLLSERSQIAAAVAASRLPAVYGYRQHIIDGGLLSYGVDLRWCFFRAATFVHKILNGMPAADLPVEFPTKVEMVVNLKVAKALGVKIPSIVLARADEVIE